MGHGFSWPFVFKGTSKNSFFSLIPIPSPKEKGYMEFLVLPLNPNSSCGYFQNQARFYVGVRA